LKFIEVVLHKLRLKVIGTTKGESKT